MTGREAARDAALLEQVRARTPWPQSPSALKHAALDSEAQDGNPTVIRERRRLLLQGMQEGTQ